MPSLPAAPFAVPPTARSALRPAFLPKYPPLQAPKLLDQVRERVRYLQLQPAYRGRIRSLVPGLHPLSLSAASVRIGWRRGGGVPDLAGRRARRGAGHALAGAVGTVVSVPKGVGFAVALDAGDRSAAYPAPVAGCFDAGGCRRRPAADGGGAQALRAVALWHRHAPDRGVAFAREGHRFRPPRYR